MQIFTAPIIEARRKRVEQAFRSLLPDNALLLFYSGEPITRPGGLDQTYPFLPHPEYYWLSGLRRPGGVVAYSNQLGWTDFIRPVSKAEKLWEGSVELPPFKDAAQIEKWLSGGNFANIFYFGQHNHTGPDPDPDPDPELRKALQRTLNSNRRLKDPAEIALIRKAADMAGAGYKKLKAIIAPGVTERHLQIEFEAEVLRAGSEKFPYDTIIGSGTNSAVLHALPTARVIQPNELILIDAGADLHDYCVDITRVFSSSGKFTAQQDTIYNLVLEAQGKAIQKCMPSVPWPEVHREAALVIAHGLKHLGLIKCDAESALETGAISVFFPHGVGHMVGLRVRDVGGDPTDTPKKYCGVTLRVDLPLQENFVMTVEPGLYFVQAILDDEDTRELYRGEINWSEVEKWRGFGGIRIEDDILITNNGPEVLTAGIEK